MSAVRLTLDEARTLATQALRAHGVSDPDSTLVADYLVRSEADGQSGHGLMRVGSYIGQVNAGKIKTSATPSLKEITPVVAVSDADNGFSYPAIQLALSFLESAANKFGIALCGVRHSHHFGQAGLHVETLAHKNLIGWCCGNTPSAMAVYGGTKPFYGTNPIAFSCPLPGESHPLVIDLALSVAARGKIVRAKQEGKKIPTDWAVDKNGVPTDDPATALSGSLMAIGGAKGSGLALMVEVLSACLTNSKLSVEADSLLEPGGSYPNLGHTFIAIAPEIIAGPAYAERINSLVSAYQDAAPEGRLPGTRRIASRKKASDDGLSITSTLHQELTSLASK